MDVRGGDFLIVSCPKNNAEGLLQVSNGRKKFTCSACRRRQMRLAALLGDDELRSARHIHFAEGRKIRKAETVVVLHLDGDNAARIINFSLAAGQASGAAASCGRPRGGHTQSTCSVRGSPRSNT